MYARIKGVPEERIKDVVEDLINYTGLTAFADVISGAYSGGTRRKLSLAIALLGDPKVVLLDEPSCGMDPHARRSMWNIIQRTMHDGRCVILTSHSMEEVEALCSRLGIMVNGVLRALGTPQYLKNRFGQGYKVEVMTVERDDCTKVISHFVDEFQAQVLERHGNKAKMRVPSQTSSVSNLFRTLENSREPLRLQEYSVSQSSLEQVFLKVATKCLQGDTKL